MYCTNCGIASKENAKFCSSCGAQIIVIHSAAPQEIEVSFSAASSATFADSPTSYPVPQQTSIGRTATVSSLSFGQANKSVFSKYATFEGRATRSEYWFFALLNALIIFGLIFLASVVASSANGSEGSVVFGYLMIMWSIAVIIPSIAVSVRRLHDAGYSGGFYFLIFIPYVGGFVLLVFMLLTSQQTDNKWGRAPKPARFNKFN